MLILGNIKILEHGSQVDSLNFYTFLILLKDTLNAINLRISHFKILSSSLDCVINCNGSDLGSWVLLDVIGSECFVDRGTEANVIEFLFWSLVLFKQRIVFFSCQIEVQHWHDTLKLGLSNMSFSELIKINEEFFNSDSLHDNSMLKSIFNISRIVWNFNSFLHEPIIDNI